MSSFDDFFEQVAQTLRDLGYTVTPPAGWESPEHDVPYVAIGAGERAPWEGLSLDCPICGEGPLPLRENVHEPSTDAGIVLRYISHCGKTWLRGGIDL